MALKKCENVFIFIPLKNENSYQMILLFQFLYHRA